MKPHNAYALRALALTVTAAVVALLGGWATTQTADALTPTYHTYTGWHYRTPDICLKTNGWRMWPWADVAAQWNRAGASRVKIKADATCTGYDLSQVIQTKTYQTTDRVCGYTDPGSVLYAGGGVYRMTIVLNTSSTVRAGCWGDDFHRRHVATHEAGHALGLSHPNVCVSIMATVNSCGWRYATPTAWDIRAVQALYDKYPGPEPVNTSMTTANFKHAPGRVS